MTPEEQSAQRVRFLGDLAALRDDIGAMYGLALASPLDEIEAEDAASTFRVVAARCSDMAAAYQSADTRSGPPKAHRPVVPDVRRAGHP